METIEYKDFMPAPTSMGGMKKNVDILVWNVVKVMTKQNPTC